LENSCSTGVFKVKIVGWNAPQFIDSSFEYKSIRIKNILFLLFPETLDRSPLNNAWKIYNFKKEKWYIFYTKKAAQREKWMKAFKDERRRVREDAKTGKKGVI